VAAAALRLREGHKRFIGLRALIVRLWGPDGQRSRCRIGRHTADRGNCSCAPCCLNVTTAAVVSAQSLVYSSAEDRFSSPGASTTFK